MRVLGIDPGLAITGYAVVEGEEGGALQAVAYGAIRTAAGRPLPERLVRIYDHLCSILDEYQPHVLAVERIFFGRNVTTALTVGQARGVVLLCAAQHQLPVVEYKPAEIKQALVGYGNAAKQQVQYMVRAQLDLPETPRPDDVADALAVALCHLTVGQFWARIRDTR
ncbi:MAG: crossover junction endodeoxyribonuclease RuvC [Chloroflexi bacterium]|nr:crossover junction endodeoxyribonuclease RuvC [Chloroflexota bacterium]